VLIGLSFYPTGHWLYLIEPLHLIIVETCDFAITYVFTILTKETESTILTTLLPLSLSLLNHYLISVSLMLLITALADLAFLFAVHLLFGRVSVCY
jgi:hypothetical protein